MKKIILLILIVMISSVSNMVLTYADDVDAEADINALLEMTSAHVSEFGYNDIESFDSIDAVEFLKTASNTLGKTVFKEFENCRNFCIYIIIISIICSLLKTYVSNDAIAELSTYACFAICSIFIVSIFKDTVELCHNTVSSLSDYMNFAIPVYASTLASCGFFKTASTIQWIFMIVSTIITGVIKNIVFPLLYCCGLLVLAAGVTSSLNISGFIGLISKTTKYIIGFLMTIFAGILTFSGLSSVSGDNIALKTAKYAIGNFVPVVGGCLSEALNSLMYSSAVTKNAIGYGGFFCLLSICLSPIIKTYIIIFMLRLSSATTTVFGGNGISLTMNSVCDVLTSMIAMVILVSVIFVLIITIVATAG